MSDEPQVDPVPADAPAPQPAQIPAVAPSAARSGSSVPLSTVVVGALLVLVLGFGAGYVVGHRHAVDRFKEARGFAHVGVPWGDGRYGSGMPGQGGYGMPGQGGYGMPGQGGYGMGGAAGSSGGGAVGGTAFAPTAVAGTVTAVDGDTMTIRTLRGETVTVLVSSATQVRTTKPASMSDLSAGAPILVFGQSNGSGGFTAVRVIEGATTPAG
jgi:Domain of unknown function (DUF5666)